jgi:putative transcriptional regulator
MTTNRDTQFNELRQSILEMRAIERGELKPGRTYTAAEVLGEERAALIEARRNTGLSQGKFAAMLNVSARTLQDWEQGRREPTGAAKTLIRIAARYPKEVLSVTMTGSVVRRGTGKHAAKSGRKKSVGATKTFIVQLGAPAKTARKRAHA